MTSLFVGLMSAAIALGVINSVLLRREERELRRLTQLLAARPCAMLEAVRLGAADRDWLMQVVCGERDPLCNACREELTRASMETPVV